MDDSIHRRMDGRPPEINSETKLQLRPNTLQPELDVLQHLAGRLPVVELSQQLHGLLVQFAPDIIFLEDAAHGKGENVRVRRGAGVGSLDPESRAADVGRLEGELDGEAITKLETRQEWGNVKVM